MAKKFSFSEQNLSIDEIAYYKQDLEKAIRFYYNNYVGNKKFLNYSNNEINEEMRLRLKELEFNAVFMLLSSIEAYFLVDYQIRVEKRLKDKLSREFRSIQKNKQTRVSLEDDILCAWQKHFVGAKEIILRYKSALRFRHWLAHGRYWKPKLGQNYDFDSIYILADTMVKKLQLKEI